MSAETDVSHDALENSEATLRQAEAMLTDLDGPPPRGPE